jgi:light-regulated signal transduction histidine kinase (bacteriophytochrome)
MSANVAVPAREPDRAIETRALLAALRELSARAGHDMVGPLNQAGSLLALLVKRYKGELDGDAHQLLEFLQSASARMEGVINGLRDYMEAVGKAPAYSALDLNGSLELALRRLQTEIAASDATIERGRLPMARADETQLSIVFEQLIENAIKFRNAGEPARIRIAGTREGDIVTVTIRDYGIGIDPEQADSIFLPFKRLNGREYPCSGLGLAAVKAIIEMHGGTIWLANPDAEGGTAIAFTLAAV